MEKLDKMVTPKELIAEMKQLGWKLDIERWSPTMAVVSMKKVEDGGK